MSEPAADPADILTQYPIDSRSIVPHPGGHINRSWRVESSTGPLLLQRLNDSIFPDGAGVVRNIVLVTRHLGDRLRQQYPADADRRCLTLLPTRSGAMAVQAPDGAWWRLVVFIAETVVRERVTVTAEAETAGRAFGEFLALLADFDGSQLTETIPHFRDTARRVAQLDHAVALDQHQRVAAIRKELTALDVRRGYAALFPPLIASGELPRRVVHNDAKSGNLLRDARSGEALAVIDLDTVMPGTALSDIGDLIRSMASPTDEDERDLSRIAVDPTLIEGLARGYFSAAGRTLVAEERRQFIAAGVVTTYEQAVRFFADYLDGDRYYRTSRAGQNLDRGRAQLALLTQLEESRSRLERMVMSL